MNKEISQPDQVFDSVQELLDCDRLNDKEKLDALKNWKDLCEHMIESSGEGMLDKDKEKTKVPETLAQVNAALEHLTKSMSSNPT